MQAANHDGYCAALLSIAGLEAEEQAVRLAAAIALKNAVKRQWNAKPAELERRGRTPIPDADKQLIMQHLHGVACRYGSQRFGLNILKFSSWMHACVPHLR